MPPLSHKYCTYVFSLGSLKVSFTMSLAPLFRNPGSAPAWLYMWCPLVLLCDIDLVSCLSEQVLFQILVEVC